MATNKKTKTANSSLIDAAFRGRANIQRVQSVLLVWLDSSIDRNSSDCQNTVVQLRHVINDTILFSDGAECIRFIKSIDDNKVCMVISGSLGPHIVPQVHDMFQVESIFICSNKKYYEQWARDWFKIKGVFSDIGLIYDALQKLSKQCEQDAIPISFVATNGGALNTSLNRLDPTFMYTKMMKTILFTIPFNQHDRNTFIEHCRIQFADNSDKLKTVNDLERAYESETPIWWYTSETFLYPMLNAALRTVDGDVMIKLGFFINDLHRQIQELYAQQRIDYPARETFKVYRGQGLSKANFEQVLKTEGGLMSFNNFLSTSRKSNVSMVFANNALNNPDSIGILFVMNIDPARSTIPFASVNAVGFFKDQEDEVLFSMHSVFRINSIEQMGEHPRLFQVNLTLTNDNDEDLLKLTARMEEETYPKEVGWFRLGCVLLKIGQPKTAEDVFQDLLKQSDEESKNGTVYRFLGSAKDDQGQYQEAIKLYAKSITIYKETLPVNHPDLATSYMYVASVYHNLGDYPKALSTHETAFEILQQSLPPDHLDLAKSLANIGTVYNSMGDYPKALCFYEKAFIIRQQALPPNHPDLAISYNSIGRVYQNMGNYPKALEFYEKDLTISQQSLPPNHPELALTYNDLGDVYESMGDYPKALQFYEKDLTISQQSLPPNHPDLAASHNCIGSVYQSMGDYSRALLSHERALAIQQESLSPNHPDLAESYTNIGSVYDSMGDYPKAFSSHEKALAIRQQALPPNHPDSAKSYNNIGLVYESMGDYRKAQWNYEQAVTISRQSLPQSHPNFQKWKANLDRVEKKV